MTKRKLPLYSTSMFAVSHFSERNMPSSLTKRHRGFIESVIIWCNDNHLKLKFSRQNQLQYNALIMDVAAVMLQSLKHGRCTHILNLAAKMVQSPQF